MFVELELVVGSMEVWKEHPKDAQVWITPGAEAWADTAMSRGVMGVSLFVWVTQS